MLALTSLSEGHSVTAWLETQGCWRGRESLISGAINGNRGERNLNGGRKRIECYSLSTAGQSGSHVKTKWLSLDSSVNSVMAVPFYLPHTSKRRRRDVIIEYEYIHTHNFNKTFVSLYPGTSALNHSICLFLCLSASVSANTLFSSVAASLPPVK